MFNIGRSVAWIIYMPQGLRYHKSRLAVEYYIWSCPVMLTVSLFNDRTTTGSTSWQWKAKTLVCKLQVYSFLNKCMAYYNFDSVTVCWPSSISNTSNKLVSQWSHNFKLLGDWCIYNESGHCRSCRHCVARIWATCTKGVTI